MPTGRTARDLIEEVLPMCPECGRSWREFILRGQSAAAARDGRR